ncbi:hypothetical protein ASG63_22595 [Methylobacterium sp. Leaf94]|uniref:hypothetical protein n=1 Tax=Methylobacterium sp. Leaf94 TaxID=1736250 RepID=UPI000701C95C|nr:hypothetical protein [Methylobacterium sp. Leaf94]KQU22074.1 hypothetical protein ASG63_22595 [Methylobacterium sp. Leaf94]
MRTALALVLILAVGSAEAACGIAQVFGGKVEVDLVQKDGYQYGIVSSANFDTKEIYGALRGRITVERGPLAVYDRDGVVVGTLPKKPGPFQSDGCAGNLRLVQAEKNTFLIMNGQAIIGTMQGALPR